VGFGAFGLTCSCSCGGDPWVGGGGGVCSCVDLPSSIPIIGVWQGYQPLVPVIGLGQVNCNGIIQQRFWAVETGEVPANPVFRGNLFRRTDGRWQHGLDSDPDGREHPDNGLIVDCSSGPGQEELTMTGYEHDTDCPCRPFEAYHHPALDSYTVEWVASEGGFSTHFPSQFYFDQVYQIINGGVLDSRQCGPCAPVSPFRKLTITYDGIERIYFSLYQNIVVPPSPVASGHWSVTAISGINGDPHPSFNVVDIRADGHQNTWNVRYQPGTQQAVLDFGISCRPMFLGNCTDPVGLSRDTYVNSDAFDLWIYSGTVGIPEPATICEPVTIETTLIRDYGRLGTEPATSLPSSVDVVVTVEAITP